MLFHRGLVREVGTQLNKAPATKGEIFDQLNLNPNVKTVGIFPHIFWDATFVGAKTCLRTMKSELWKRSKRHVRMPM